MIRKFKPHITDSYVSIDVPPHSANGYQSGQSEKWLGEWFTKTGRRDDIVLATKYTAAFRPYETNIQSNDGGNGAKSMHVSVEASLKKLKTDYIDLFYVHYWDLKTSIAELMQSLNYLVASGKVLYLGISNSPAWMVVKCNEYARQHGLRQFSVYQGRWSAAERDLERDILPMLEHEGMGLAPWGALGNGLFKTPDEKNEGGRNMPQIATGKEETVIKVLQSVAQRHQTAITSVALAYVMHKAPYVFPICGGRKVEHMRMNIEALGLKLNQEDIDEIETGYSFDVGFPMNLMGGGPKGARGPEDVAFSKRMGFFDYVKKPGPITPQDPKTLSFRA